MEITELDKHLRELSEHERGYRDGTYTGVFGGDGFVINQPSALYIRQHSRFVSLPYHTHNNVEISYVYAGKCPQHVMGSDITLTENQVLLLDKDCSHSIEALSEEDIMLSVMLSRSFLEQCLMNIGAPESAVSRFLVNSFAAEADHRHHILFQSQYSRRIRRYFQELFCEELDPSPAAEQIRVALVRLILIELVNVYEADYNRREEATHRVSVIPIMRYIEQHYESCTQKEVAERFFISPNYVSTLLKQHTGMTFIQLVQSQRLSHAAVLIRSTNASIEDIARECGYENMSFFYRKFKERYRVNPGEYRATR